MVIGLQGGQDLSEEIDGLQGWLGGGQVATTAHCGQEGKRWAFEAGVMGQWLRGAQRGV